MLTDEVVTSTTTVTVEILALRVDASGCWAYRRMVTTPLPGESPDQAARRMSGVTADERNMIVHSTSWRYEPSGEVVLTYALCPDPWTHLPATPLPYLRVARGGAPATPTPDDMTMANVVAHGIRHLAFLKVTDPVVRATLELEPAIAAGLDRLCPISSLGVTVPQAVSL
ncbi:hypothetical protein Sme01_40470 [Sphaerisporangium melleum]|uniref:Uncharacterized protein n=1 Tax=Sphaerisporangium melleum TaxID=321316 RepID=A0A917RSE4_9ACTN|nr:hypothetical protein [Sphaerisporangium melleum]GGL21621.1 hypothetical protein GCM10007964_74420 [Sphaerisporangium melleum]GII71571.1 hypothetical protein Sme01_40470 [Sphaerisporangium melleum]